MIRYLARRLILALPVIVGTTLIVFIAVRLAPGDVALAILGEQADAQTLEAIRRERGLDRPFHEQYARFLGNLVQLDLGRSLMTHQPVAEEIAARLPTTAKLAIAATILASALGMTLGVLAAWFHRKWPDYVLMVGAMLALSIPNYVIGLIFILFFSVHLRLLPATGGDGLVHLILPVTTIGLVGAGVIARQTRSAVLDVLADDYVRTARAKGLGERVVLFRHALRNALIPLITVIGLVFGNLLSGTVIVETIFSVPGMGKLMIDRIEVRDYAAVQGAVLVIALGYVLVNIIVDVAYTAADKRVRLW